MEAGKAGRAGCVAEAEASELARVGVHPELLVEGLALARCDELEVVPELVLEEVLKDRCQHRCDLCSTAVCGRLETHA